MALTSGERLGPYEILGAVGAGGMGEVYRARDTRLQRDVAVKLLPVGRLEDAGALRRFEQEARTLAALNHPNLLTVFDVGTTAAGALYLITELLDGATLREKLTAGKLPQRTAVDFGMQMARGLAAAHEKGIIHRDLKPENIFCTGDGRVKILDFGLAKLTAETGAEDKTVVETGTAAGVVLGTVGYMAPEQARGQAADARSDIFSLGCVLYEMLAGRRAFRGDSAADVISAILREDPPDLAAASSSGSGVGAVPIALERIVRHCLEKEPRQRFQSASDVAFSLADLSWASSAASGAMAAVPGPSRSRRRLGLAGLAFAGVAAGLAAGWWLWRTQFTPPQFQQVTYQQGIVSSARFLPDGQGILSAAAWNNGPYHLFTSRFDSTGQQTLDADADNVLAVKKGEAAVLQNTRRLTGYAARGTLARMPLGGGAPRAMLPNVMFADYNPIHGDLAITRYHPESINFSLEYPVGHVLYQAPGWISDPRFSRDGAYIAFIAHPVLGDDLGAVDMVDMSGHVRQLTSQFASARGLAWSPSGEIWFSGSSQGPTMSLHAVSVSGRERRLAAAPTSLYLQDVAADGRALLMSETLRLSASLVTPSHPQPRDFTILSWNIGDVLSPDGEQLLVGDEQAGKLYSTYLRQADGSPPVRLGDGTPIAFSPDKQWAVSVVPDTQQLWLLPTGAGEPHQLTHGKVAFGTDTGHWLPDGKSLLAIGNLPGHPLRTYRIGLDGGETPVTPEGVVGTLVTPDGRFLLARPTPGGYALYPLAGGAPREVRGLKPGEAPLEFAADGHSVFAESVSDPQRGEIWKVDLDTGQRQHLFDVPPAGNGGIRSSFVTDISADGRNYVIFTNQRLNTIYVADGIH